MAIVGHGVDLVETKRIGEMLSRHEDRFLERCFTQGERDYALGKKRELEHLAGRFAAKEAVMKALASGWRHGMAWTDIEVALEPSGRPIVRLSGKAREIADELGADTWWLSISHVETHAIASAIAEGAGQDR